MIKAFDTTIIDKSWDAVVRPQMEEDYFQKLQRFVAQERQNHDIYPPQPLVFNAFRLTAFSELKVVLLGQDPYHQPHQAQGLAFSVPPEIKKPPSLRNIFKELHDDCGIAIPQSGDLTPWAVQGVLLLNTILTVRKGKPRSHHNKGWERFTDTVISAISQQKRPIVFLLWGAHAQSKEPLIDSRKHHILKAAHPSPYSAYAGFFGCRHFSRTNAFLQKHRIQAVDWRI